MSQRKFLDEQGLVRFHGKIDSIIDSVNDRITQTTSTLCEQITAAQIEAHDAVTAVSNDVQTKATKATTLAGYEIGDAYTKGEVDTSLVQMLNNATSASKEYTDGVIKTLEEAYLKGTAGTETIDTLNEIAGWIVDDEAGAAKVIQDVANLQNDKVDKITGKGLSTNDYTTEEKTKLANIDGDINKVVEDATTYTNTDPLLTNVGGILAKNHPTGFSNVSVTDLITELLYPYTQPSVGSLTLSPSAGVKEMNVDLTVNSATISVTKKSKSIKSVDLYKGTTLVESKTEGVANGGSFTFTINETLDGSTDTSYQVKVIDEQDTAVSSNTQTYDFVYPYFYGVTGDVEVTSVVILGMTKDVRTKGNHSRTYTTTSSQHPVIAYPKEYGPLKEIKDANGFTHTWTQTIVTVDNDTTINGVDYYVYVGGAAEATGMKYNFNY